MSRKLFSSEESASKKFVPEKKLEFNSKGELLIARKPDPKISVRTWVVLFLAFNIYATYKIYKLLFKQKKRMRAILLLLL